MKISFTKRKSGWQREPDRIIGITDKETKRKAVEQAKAYILGNWSGIMIAMKSGDSNVRCSAEGHVSHVYADRMSSRPLGWCRTGADKMSRLRIYRQNQGNMLELVRYQKKEMKQVSGAEEIIYSATEMIRMEKSQQTKTGEYWQICQCMTFPLSADQKDSGAEKSHLGFVKRDKKVIMMEKTLILKHISRMLCLLISYSKFTRTRADFGGARVRLFMI